MASNKWLLDQPTVRQYSATHKALESRTCLGCSEVSAKVKHFDCGHIFCLSCLRSNTSDNCPLDCFVEISKEDQNNEELHTKASCPHRSTGCPVVIKREEMQSHLANCYYATVKCPQGCNEHVTKLQLLQHLQSECQHRLDKCTRCNRDVIVAKLKEHDNECTMYPVKCPYECGAIDIPRQLIGNHISKCNKSIISCKYKHIGCTFQGSQVNLELHESDAAAHLELVIEHHKIQEAQFAYMLSQMKAHIFELENELGVCHNRMDTYHTYTEIMKQHMHELTQKVVNVQVHKLQQTKNGPSGDSTSAVKSLDDKVESCSKELDDVTDSINELRQQLDILQFAAVPNNQQVNVGMENIQQQIDGLWKRVDEIQGTSTSGSFVWKLEHVQQRLKDAVNRKILSVTSKPFFTSPHGYKMCMRVFLNGDGDARGNHMSLFVAFMKGPYDAILKWPFVGKVTMVLINQLNRMDDIQYTFRSSATSRSSQQPTKEVSYGAGAPNFAPTRHLNDPCFVMNNTIFFQAIVSEV